MIWSVQTQLFSFTEKTTTLGPSPSSDNERERGNKCPLGNFSWNIEDVTKSVVCILMSGPFLTGYTQTLNDWYDREIDAINEPYRPIPAGAISENEVIIQIWLLLLGGLCLGYLLDVWAAHEFPIILYLAVGGSLISYIYSAPPLKVGWPSIIWYINSRYHRTHSLVQYCWGALCSETLGIAIVNDFKSIEGDRAKGLQSVPVTFGIDTAKWISVGAIDVTQISIAGYLLGVGKPYHALSLLALIIPQAFFQFNYLLKDPVKNDVKYQKKCVRYTDQYK
ncbi:hypothetical protein Taro_034441 [Colocasia esculenta]|uniref:Uncharacterized protein n=1 Tax=Colocasia esculenta TaxID=4460 RepID=A0A843WBY3_COLES|nr:hypothetical protein [Colocasia esculenta]